MAEQSLDQAPIWDDLVTFPGTEWCGAVDLISAGFPCQPFSVAGKQLGIEDDRWLWPNIARLIGDIQPRFVFLENVPGLIQHGLGYVLQDLARLGFDAEWDLFSATNVGAPHLRKRVFILAHSNGQRLEELWWPESALTEHSCPERDRLDLANPDQGERSPPHDGDGSVELGHQHLGPDPRVVGLWPPGPDESARWATVLGANPDLCPALRQDGSLAVVHGVVDGVSDRLDRLHCLGNAVVPQVVAYAWGVLAERAQARRLCPKCRAQGVVRAFEPDLLRIAQRDGKKITCTKCMGRFTAADLGVKT